MSCGIVLYAWTGMSTRPSSLFYWMDFYVSLWCSSCLLFLSCFSPGWLFGLRDIPPEVTSSLVNRSYIQRNKPVHQHRIWTRNQSIITAMVTTERFTPPSVIPPALLTFVSPLPDPSFLSRSTFIFSILHFLLFLPSFVFPFPYSYLSSISSSSLFLLSHSLTLSFRPFLPLLLFIFPLFYFLFFFCTKRIGIKDQTFHFLWTEFGFFRSCNYFFFHQILPSTDTTTTTGTFARQKPGQFYFHSVTNRSLWIRARRESLSMGMEETGRACWETGGTELLCAICHWPEVERKWEVHSQEGAPSLDRVHHTERAAYWDGESSIGGFLQQYFSISTWKDFPGVCGQRLKIFVSGDM